MSKLTFWGRLFCPTIAERSDCHFENGLGDLMESTNMTKMSLWFEGLFCLLAFFVLGELALCKSPRRLLFVKE